MRLKQVVLPAPLGPIRPVKSPRRSSSEKSETADSPPNWRLTSRTSSNGSVVFRLTMCSHFKLLKVAAHRSATADVALRLSEVAARDAAAIALDRPADPVAAKASSGSEARNK